MIKRFLLMLVLMVAITVTSFIIIQLPPGDFLTMHIEQLRSQGQNVTDDQIAALTAQYGLGQPMPVQFFKWVSGFPRGNFGYSFALNRPAVEVIIPAFKISLLIALVVFVTTTVIGLLIGYFTAKHKNSFIDYFFSFWGYIGISVPGFVVAMLALWGVYQFTGKSFIGLFSREYITAPWSLEKALDGMFHLLLPVLVITFTNLAGFKSFRANMLDEINKPYVVTARAKGVKENRLLVKYPARMALIPNMGSIGLAIPMLISGEAIAGIVLNLPTLGPLMLNALRSQDMYLAGAILLFQSMMTLVGTLVSDIALALIDPRIRLDR
jgi:peptide/nickel transport system permease protein